MSYNNSKAARRRRRRRKKILQTILPPFIAVVLIIIVGFAGQAMGWFDSWGYSTEKADLNSYFQCTGADQATVIRNGEMTEERMLVKDNRLYLDMDTIASVFNDGFYWESTSGNLLFTADEGTYSTALDSMDYKLNGSSTQTGYTTCYLKGETLMVCLDYVSLFSDFEYRLYGGAAEPYRCELKTEWGTKNVANVTKDDVAIRIEPDKKANVLKEVSEGSKVVVVASENEDWMKVTSEDLITGYIEKKHIGDSASENEGSYTAPVKVEVTPVADYSKDVVLAWHNVTTEEAASYLNDYTKYLDNFNVISPTWFSISDNEGTIASICSEKYVNVCHEKGLKVWGLVDNLTYPDVSTYTVLSNADTRKHVITQLLEYAVQYNLDGINVDFEQLTNDSGPAFVQFVKELTLEAHKMNLVISVDNYVPKEYSSQYNRKQQGIFADYVIIMGYDEHVAGSEEAGSVASIDFVMEGIEKTLEEVPAKKVINAVPFYTRYWSLSADGVVADCQTLPMATGIETVSKAGVTAAWDDMTNQNYAQWDSNGLTNKIWLEDADSLNSKMKVMKSKDIGGVAVWQLAYSMESAWEVINEYYKP